MSDVAVVIESMGGGGAQQVVSALLSHWVRAGHGVDLITFRDPSDDAFAVPPQVRRQVLGAGAPSCGPLDAALSNIRRLLTLRSMLSKSQADTVIAFVGTTNILTILASLGLARRVIVSERNDPRRQKLPAIWALLRRLAYPLATAVTVNSRAAAEALAAMGIARRVAYLPNPLRQPTSAEIAPKDGPVLLAVGRLHPQKGYDRLLAAFARAQPAMRGWQLRILGTGPLDAELRETARRFSLSVDFRGYVSDPFPHYRAADIFVMASRYEGSPNALWEAMSCAVPAIVSDNLGDAGDIIKNGESGLLVAADDLVQLADAMAALAADENRRKQLGAAGQEAVRCFSPDAAFAEWDRLIFNQPATGHA